MNRGSQDCVVGIETRLQAGRSGIRRPVKTRDFFTALNTGPVPPPVQWSPGFLPGGKADHSPAPSAVIKHEWYCSCTPS